MHCDGCRTRGGGLLAGLAALAGVAIVLVAGYRVADSTLDGVAASAAAVNQIAAWVAAVVTVVVAVTAGGWLLLARYRTVRDAPIEAAFHAQVHAALTTRAAQVQTVTALPGVPARLRVQAVRRDRPGIGSGIGGPR